MNKNKLLVSQVERRYFWQRPYNPWYMTLVTASGDADSITDEGGDVIPTALGTAGLTGLTGHNSRYQDEICGGTS